jgi:hypothetical protein
MPSSCKWLRSGKLGCNEWWVVGGIYSPNHQTSRLVGLTVVWCTGQSGVHRTCPVRQPRHQSRWVPTVGALSSGPAWMFGGASDMYCSVRCATSRVPDFCALWRALIAVAGDRWREVAVAPELHRTVRCTPDMSGEL